MRPVQKLLVGALFGFVLSLGYIGLNESGASLKAVGGSAPGSDPTFGTITATTKFVGPTITGASTATGMLFSLSGPTALNSSGQNAVSLGRVDGYSVVVTSGGSIGWSSSATDSSTAADTILTRDGAANTGAQKNGNADQIWNRYGGNGGFEQCGSVSENLTLSTGGTTTNTAANLLPANANIKAVTARVTTTVATATSWQLGDATIAGRFTAAQSGAQLTAGATVVGLVHIDQTGTSGPRQSAASTLRVTTVGTPSAGAIRITSYYCSYTAATS